MSGPSPHVLDLFAVPDDVQALAGSRGAVRAGDLVLSPNRDPNAATWLSPMLARLAVTLDEQPGRSRRDLRVAMPVPARDGSWVVDGWAASRWEPGTTVCHDLDVTLAAGRLLHARLASLVDQPPALPTDEALRLVGGPVAALPARPLVRRAAAARKTAPLGLEQLVHTELAGNVLLDASGAPVVLGVAPAWAPVRWAEALCVLDAAPTSMLARWSSGEDRQAMIRAVLFRLVQGCGETDEGYAEVLDRLGVPR